MATIQEGKPVGGIQPAPAVKPAPVDTSAQGAQGQMASYDKYAQQALGANPSEAMQKAQAAAAQGAQSTSDQAVQQAIKAGKSAGAMGGQAALAATGQAANAYGQAQQAGQQQYFNTAQLGAQLGSEMSGRLQAQAQNAANIYGIQTGAETSRYGTQAGAESQRYSTDVGAASDKYSTDASAKAAAEANKTNKRGQNIGLVGQGIGAVAGLAGLFSDRNLKEDISPTKATDGLEQLKAYTYKYKKGPAYAGGRDESGVMAQDLEKTGMRQAVMDTPEGKKIDTNRLSTMNTGAIAEQEKRMQRIENILKGLGEIQKPGSK